MRRLPVLAALAALAVLPLLSGCVPFRAAAAPLPAPAPTENVDETLALPLPVPAGGTVTSGPFEFTLSGVRWDRTPKILQRNVDPATVPDGYGYALVTLSAKNITLKPASVGLFTITVHAAGWHVDHRAIANDPIVIPDRFVPTELGPGESVTGNLGFWLPVDVAATDPTCVVELTVPGWVLDKSPDRFMFGCGP